MNGPDRGFAAWACSRLARVAGLSGSDGWTPGAGSAQPAAIWAVRSSVVSRPSSVGLPAARCGSCDRRRDVIRGQACSGFDGARLEGDRRRSPGLSRSAVTQPGRTCALAAESLRSAAAARPDPCIAANGGHRLLRLPYATIGRGAYPSRSASHGETSRSVIPWYAAGGRWLARRRARWRDQGVEVVAHRPSLDQGEIAGAARRRDGEHLGFRPAVTRGQPVHLPHQRALSCVEPAQGHIASRSTGTSFSTPHAGQAQATEKPPAGRVPKGPPPVPGCRPASPCRRSSASRSSSRSPPRATAAARRASCVDPLRWRRIDTGACLEQDHRKRRGRRLFDERRQRQLELEHRRTLSACSAPATSSTADPVIASSRSSAAIRAPTGCFHQNCVVASSPQRGEQRRHQRRAGRRRAKSSSRSSARPNGRSATCGNASPDRPEGAGDQLRSWARSGSVTSTSRSQPSFSSLSVWIATALALASRSGSAWYSDTQQRKIL